MSFSDGVNNLWVVTIPNGNVLSVDGYVNKRAAIRTLVAQELAELTVQGRQEYHATLVTFMRDCIEAAETTE